MKFFSDCSGQCALCACGGGCAAGHGDDDYYPASKEQLINRLDNYEYGGYRSLMIDTLKQKFNYIYQDTIPPEVPVYAESYTVKLKDGVTINVINEALDEIITDPKLIEQFDMETHSMTNEITSIRFKQKQ